MTEKQEQQHPETDEVEQQHPEMDEVEQQHPETDEVEQQHPETDEVEQQHPETDEVKSQLQTVPNCDCMTWPHFLLADPCALHTVFQTPPEPCCNWRCCRLHPGCPDCCWSGCR